MRSPKWFPASFHVMAKPRGAICNLNCEYCFYLEKENLYPGKSLIMDDTVLEMFVKQYIEAQRVPAVTFAWQGGEPTLLKLEFFEKALNFQQKYARPGMKIDNVLQTNGTLLDDDWGVFLHDNNFLVGISIDGPPDLHDCFRKNKSGGNTFSQVMRGLEMLKKHKVEHNILCAVQTKNVEHPLEVYRFFTEELSETFIQFIPIVEKQVPSDSQVKVTDFSITGEQLGKFLIAIFDEWVQKDVGSVFIQAFDDALRRWLRIPGGLCVFSKQCGDALAIEHNGDLFSCDHFVDEQHKLGNITQTRMIDLVTSEPQYIFGTNKAVTLPKYCLECEVLFACNGGCPKNRFAITPNGETGLNHLCEGYKAFFNHIDEPMREMIQLIKNKRPPAEIMKSGKRNLR
jgi:uncharacterized protein